MLIFLFNFLRLLTQGRIGVFGISLAELQDLNFGFAKFPHLGKYCNL